MAFTILQISDTHLSPRTRHFRANNAMLLPLLARDQSEEIIHTGDITLDGIRYDEDFALCRKTFDSLGRNLRYLAGNHDIGDNPALSQPADEGGSRITDERRQRFLDWFGPDYWSFDRDNWRVLGLSSMLAGSGLGAEAAQFDWIDAQLADLGDRHLAVFTHQPLFIDDRKDASLTYWTIDPSAWPRLEALMTHPALRLIASGHLHQQRSRQQGALALEWCSSVAFTTGESLVPEMGGSRQVGYMSHLLGDDGQITSRVIEADLFDNDHLEDSISEVYPSL